MDHQSEWRLDAARTLVAKLEGKSGLRAVQERGSAARNYSDVYSGLELMAYWDSVPGQDEKRTITHELGAVHKYPSMDHRHESALEIRGFPVTLLHQAVADEERTLDRVLSGFSTDLKDNYAVDNIHCGIPLFGDALIKRWQERTAKYPDELAFLFLDQYLPQFDLQEMHLAARRNNPVAFFHSLSGIHSSLFVVLLALNGSYFPTYKWMFNRLHELPLKPVNLEKRLRQMYKEAPSHAVENLREVLKETLHLVDSRYPDVATELAWHGLNLSKLGQFSENPFG